MMGKIVTLGMGIIFIIGCGSSPGDSFYEIDISKPEEGENFTIPTEPGQIGVEATNIPVERNSDPEWYMAENTLAWDFTSYYDPRPTVSKGTLSKSSLYDNNDDFGDHTVTVSFVDTSGETQANGVIVQIFYKRDDWNGGGGSPNWYYYWKQGNVVSDLSYFSYTNENLYGKYVGGILYVGNLAPTDNDGPITVTNKNTGERHSIGASGSGIDCTAKTSAHELKHKENSNLTGTDSDGDGLPDNYELSSPYNLDPDWPDTYDVAGATGVPQYFYVGDDEFIARIAEQNPGATNPRADWSDTNGKNWGN